MSVSTLTAINNFNASTSRPISISNATPPRPTFQTLNSSESLTDTPSSGVRRHRLLYRGALSLPDSWLTLDGLTFSASAGAHTQAELLENPLALALESMRGRPTIHLVGMTRLKELKDLWLDEAGDVSL